MGIEYNALKALSLIDSRDKSLRDIATIGRQSMQIKPSKISFFNLSKKHIDELKKEKFADKLLKMIGFNTIHSFDFSNYEDANFIHDMNTPIEDIHKNKYDIVFDGGSLEHIFNFPVAVKNCMEMLKTDGYFLSVTTCNNFSGHGFYQFSPELFFRVFTKDNGFEMIDIFISENNKWYKVHDPEKIKSRVTFKNKHETYIIVIAKKIANTEIFKNTPQQSDYVECWKNEENIKEKNVKKLIRKMKQIYSKLFVRYDKKFFTKIK
jgi:SAM-dependent methyltransferase